MRSSLTTLLALALLIVLGLFCTRCHRPQIETLLVDGVADGLAVAGLGALDVSHVDRSIVLRGAVPSEAERRRAVEIAGGVRGVRRVADELTVAAPAPLPAPVPEVDETTEALPVEQGEGRPDVAAQPPLECRARVARLLDEDAVFFATDSARLDADARAWLDRVATALADCPGAGVLVVGHADRRGDAEYNQALSGRRVDAVLGYLTERGVDANRLERDPEGEEGLPSDAAAELQRHRRVDLILEGGE